MSTPTHEPMLKVTPAMLAVLGLLVLSSASFVGWDFLRAIRQAQSLYSVGILGVSLQGEIQFFTQESRRTVSYALTTNDPNLQLPFVDQARTASQRVDSLVQNLLALDLSQESRNSATHFADRWKEYVSVRDEIIAGILEEEIKQALMLDMHEGVQKFEAASDALHRFKDQLDRDSARQSGNVRNAFYRAAIEMAALLAGTLLFIGVVARDLEKRKAVEALRAMNRDLRLARETAEKANKALLLQKVELERSNQELEQFAYVASHDLQEPLRMVSNYTQLLARRYKGKLDADADDFIGFAVDGAKRMQLLITDLLSLSRVGSRATSFKPIELGDVVKQAIANLQMAIQESQARVDCATLPMVMADRGQLVQLFQNLIGNAIKYRQDRNPEVRIQADGDGENWLFRITDNGIGFDPKQADRIFMIFQRLHTRQEYSGTGIGLAVCKKIVERHGGRIWADSIPGEGSTFSFTIPDTVTAEAAHNGDLQGAVSKSS